MNKKRNVFRFGLVGVALAFLMLPAVSWGQDLPQPPLAERIVKELTIHGHTRIDPYYWLNERANPKVIDYLKAENAYTDAVMKPTLALQEKLYQELAGRKKQDDMSVPYGDNGYFYYTRYVAGKNYPLYCRKKGSLQGSEEVMLDGNRMAEGKAYFAIADAEVSPDNTLLAYSVDYVSRRQYRIQFKNLNSGKVYEESIPMTDGQIVWANDSKTVFYPVIDPETLRSCRIRRHVLGTATATDVEVYNETDETFSAYLGKSRSRQYIFITSQSTLTSEYRYLDAGQPRGGFKVFQPRLRGLLYEVDHLGDRFYIRTNDGARNFKLMEAAAGNTARESWRELIPHRDDVLLEDVALFNGYLVLGERRAGLPQIRVIPWGQSDGYYLDFPEPTYMVAIRPVPEPGTDLLRFSYQSPVTPDSTYDFNMKTKERLLLKQNEVLGGYTPGNYRTERLMAPGHDGTLVPISLVYKLGMERDGENPLLLEGYGSYGYSSDPYFNSNVLSLLNRGFIYAIAHIRGGQEMGRSWYEDGKLFKKINTFTDFISCAEYLVRHRYTSPAKLCAEGASAGGLLMGAVVNLQPDLFHAVIAGVPFVDVVTTMLDSSIPLTTAEYDEWGDPNRPECYEYMLSYSPYDNVRAKAYPALLVTTGLHDSQVQYFEPAKWVAKLRVTKTDRNPLILKTNMDAGHGGASGRFRRLREVAFQYAFLLEQLGIRE
ncbi:MAG: S9 family peptidase [Candidatus Aminicenantes bacterium]|nr:S9 family peptidase [Candidatus Aminicenantes bacterium]